MSGKSARPQPRSPRTNAQSQRALHRRPQARRTRWRVWLPMSAAGGALVVVLLVVALRAGPHAASGDTSATVPRVSLEAAADGAADVGQQAAGFAATSVWGGAFRLPAGKPTVLYFMAGWCSSCVPEAEALARIDRQDHGRVAILAVDADPTDPLSSLENFMQQIGDPGYSFAQDEGGKLVQAFGARALDTTVVVDAGGTVVYRNTVPIDDQTLRAALVQAGLR